MPTPGRRATSRLQESARLLFKLKARPTTKEMPPLAEPWRPWRAAAAYMLWTYYRDAKQRDGAPIAAGGKTATKVKAARPKKPAPDIVRS